MAAVHIPTITPSPAHQHRHHALRHVSYAEGVTSPWADMESTSVSLGEMIERSHIRGRNQTCIPHDDACISTNEHIHTYHRLETLVQSVLQLDTEAVDLRFLMSKFGCLDCAQTRMLAQNQVLMPIDDGLTT